jgi:hypothetical protein
MATETVLIWLMIEGTHNSFIPPFLHSSFSCVTDRSLLAEIAYNEKSFTAYAHTHVFRYADRSGGLLIEIPRSIFIFFRVQLFFTCTVQLCFREDGGCEGISPPHCLDKKGGPPSTY